MDSINFSAVGLKMGNQIEGHTVATRVIPEEETTLGVICQTTNEYLLHVQLSALRKAKQETST